MKFKINFTIQLILMAKVVFFPVKGERKLQTSSLNLLTINNSKKPRWSLEKEIE